MLGIKELFFTVIVIAAVWYGYKWFDRITKAAKREVEGSGKKAGARAVDQAEEMVKCRVCGIYIAADLGTGCGRDDCPYPG